MKKILIMLLFLFTLACSNKETKLTEEDFNITYKDTLINDKVLVNDITSKLGFGIGHEDNNYGLISQGNGFMRWGLYYPGRENTELRLVYLEGDLVYADLYSVPTKRNIKVGDLKTKLIKVYGEGSKEGNKIIYNLEEKFIRFEIDSSTDQVSSILIDYNSKKADKDQGIAKDLR
jgi:hypothetical protein